MRDLRPQAVGSTGITVSVSVRETGSTDIRTHIGNVDHWHNSDEQTSPHQADPVNTPEALARLAAAGMTQVGTSAMPMSEWLAITAGRAMQRCSDGPRIPCLAFDWTTGLSDLVARIRS